MRRWPVCRMPGLVAPLAPLLPARAALATFELVFALTSPPLLPARAALAPNRLSTRPKSAALPGPLA